MHPQLAPKESLSSIAGHKQKLDDFGWPQGTSKIKIDSWTICIWLRLVLILNAGTSQINATMVFPQYYPKLTVSLNWQLDISVISGTFATLPVAHHSSQYSEKLSICGAGKENPWRLMNPPFSHSLFGKIFWWELQQRFLHNKCQITEPFLHNFVHCGSKALTHISKIGTWKSFICPNNMFFSSVVRVWRNPSPRLAPVLEPP